MTEPTTQARVCLDCGGTFEGGSRAKRCEPCRTIDKRAKQRQRMAAWRAAQPKPALAPVVCRDCGVTFEHTKPGGRITKKLCADCLTAAPFRLTRKPR